jgi:hypothetical protein
VPPLACACVRFSELNYPDVDLHPNLTHLSRLFASNIDPR